MKKLLSFTVAALAISLATQASAYDLIHPFYGPGAGELLSETGFEYIHSKGEKYSVDTKSIIKYAYEDLAYGVTDKFTVYGGVYRMWNRNRVDTPYESIPYKDKADSWSLGASYTLINDGKHYLDIKGIYSQEKLDKYSMGKYYSVTGKYGYNFDCGTPYLTVQYFNSLNLGKDNDEEWTAKASFYKNLTNNLGGELGIAYVDGSGYSDYKSWNLEAYVGYMISQNISVNLAGTYSLDTQRKGYYGLKYDCDKYTVLTYIDVAF